MLQLGKKIGESTALRPALKSLKNNAESALNKRTGDVVLFNKGLVQGTGMTDISFENHKAKKRLSLYFTSKPEGIESYRRCAAMLAHIETIELKYTPQFGQSRISFEWDEFWEMMEQNKLGILTSETSQPILQLESNHIIDIKEDDGSIQWDEVKKIE